MKKEHRPLCSGRSNTGTDKDFAKRSARFPDRSFIQAKLQAEGYPRWEARRLALALIAQYRRVETRFGDTVPYYGLGWRAAPPGERRRPVLIVPIDQLSGSQKDIATTMAIESGGGLM